MQFFVISVSSRRPVRNAEILVQPVDSYGRAVGQSIELKTHEDGKATGYMTPYAKFNQAGVREIIRFSYVPTTYHPIPYIRVNVTPRNLKMPYFVPAAVQQ